MYDYAPEQKFKRPEAEESHTVEFQNTLRHDTNFNSIEKAKYETFFAAKLIRDPQAVWSTVSDLGKKLLRIIAAAKDAGKAGNALIEFLEKDTGVEGQFGRISGGIAEIEGTLKATTPDPILFVKKMLVIKSFGAYIIDFASKKHDENEFIFGGLSKEHNDALISEFRPDALFRVRGRTGIVSKRHRDDIGIMDEQTFSALPREEQDFLRIPGLSKSRPLFRTFTHETVNGEKVEAPFVKGAFDKDLPLVGAVSGSTSCIMVGANTLSPSMGDDDRRALAISAVAFLVGGGYHSAAEVLVVAYRGLKL